MDEIVDGSGYVIHIHNYSFVAIKSFIAEVKKYPIIYNGNARKEGIPISSGLIDFGWARIVAALLNSSVNFDLTQRRYWERSFRELWKWMTSVLKRDVIARHNNPIHVHGSDNLWLADLKFLEPYVQMSLLDEYDIDCELDPGVNIEVRNSEAVVDLDDNNHTVVWLRDSTESSDGGNLHISICLRVPVEMCVNFNKKEPGLGVIVPLENPSTSLRQVLNIPSSSTDIRNLPPTSRFLTTHQGCSGALEIDTTMRMPNGMPTPTIIDEDYRYVMSLLPLLQDLPPKRKSEVKVQIVQALHESFL